MVMESKWCCEPFYMMNLILLYLQPCMDIQFSRFIQCPNVSDISNHNKSFPIMPIHPKAFPIMPVHSQSFPFIPNHSQSLSAIQSFLIIPNVPNVFLSSQIIPIVLNAHVSPHRPVHPDTQAHPGKAVHCTGNPTLGHFHDWLVPGKLIFILTVQLQRQLPGQFRQIM